MQNPKEYFKIILFPVLLLISFTAYAEWKQPVALQPFGRIAPELLQKMKAGIEKTYCRVEVEIKPAIPLPKAAYYEPRERYRSKKLLYYLEIYYSKKIKKRYTKVIGITSKDISTTKGEYHDWGIFGQAFLRTGPCIVSFFRLNRGAKSREHFFERLLKVTIHELGHTYGLHHCPTANCVMADARASIKPVDASDGKFCAACRGQIYRVLCR